MTITLTVNTTSRRRFWIEVPEGYAVTPKGVEVPCPFEPGETMLLTDQFLLVAARDGEFGLRLLCEEKPGWVREDASAETAGTTPAHPQHGCDPS